MATELPRKLPIIGNISFADLRPSVSSFVHKPRKIRGREKSIRAGGVVRLMHEACRNGVNLACASKKGMSRLGCVGSTSNGTGLLIWVSLHGPWALKKVLGLGLRPN